MSAVVVMEGFWGENGWFYRGKELYGENIQDTFSVCHHLLS
jgi:hypothetical protein